MKNKQVYTRSELEKVTGLNKYKLLRIINSLINKGIIIKKGNAINTYYFKSDY